MGMKITTTQEVKVNIEICQKQAVLVVDCPIEIDHALQKTRNAIIVKKIGHFEKRCRTKPKIGSNRISVNQVNIAKAPTVKVNERILIY